MHVIFVSLASYQTAYFESIAQSFLKTKFNVTIIYAHEHYQTKLIHPKCSVVKIFDVEKELANKKIVKNAENICNQLLPNNTNFLLSHELVTFRKKSLKPLRKEFETRLLAFNHIFEDVVKKYQSSKEIFVIQELGGFISNLACFCVCNNLEIDHFFLEPSIFPGRLLVSKNSFSPPKIETESILDNYDLVVKILNEKVQKKSLLIPAKDKDHYRSPIKKIVDPQNIPRLKRKIFNFIRRQQSEFDNSFLHIVKHLEMLRNSQILQKVYYNKLPNKTYIYFPLHVPWDVALTIRSPEYLDQLNLLEYILKVIPDEIFLCVKEHPALIGAIGGKNLKILCKKYPNFVLLNPGINNFDVMANAKLIITINSKSGAEGLALGKDVIVLGDAFYSCFPNSYYCESLKNLKSIVSDRLSFVEAQNLITQEKVYQSFTTLYNLTIAGEINSKNQEVNERFVQEFCSNFVSQS